MPIFRKGNVCVLLLLMFLTTFAILIISEITLHGPSKSFQSQIFKGKHKVDMHDIQIMNSEHLSKENNSSIPKWQAVNGTRFKFYVYSAFLDRRYRNHHFIRIIATTKTKKQDRVSCLFQYVDSSELVSAKIRVINENWSLLYSAVFVICNLKNATYVPVYVSVVGHECTATSHITNRLPILNSDSNFNRKTESKERIAVCIKPIHFNYDKIFELVEFLELSKLLGIDHFTTYDSSMSPRTTCILNEYVNEGIVSIYPWHLPLKSKVEIRTENIFAALNDCLYRNMFLYSYILFVDLDEFVVPKFNLTIHELLRWLNVRYDTTRISAYSFQNAFFYRQWEDDSGMRFANAIEKYLITLRKTRRKKKLNPHKQRSKFIVKPENVVEVGNHFVWQFLPNQNTLNVPPEIAILNHYRVCEFGGDDCVNQKSIVDRTLYRYRRSLECKFAQIWNSLTIKCSLPRLNLSDVYDIC